VPAGTTVEDIVAQLRFMMGRYQTMRTRLRHDPDGRTRQVVFASGEVALEVIDVADGDDPGEVAERTRERFCDTDYDFVDEWPVRMALIRHRGVPTHQAVAICHLVTDGFGTLVLIREREDRDLVHGGRPAPPITALEPMEQARWQASPAGRRELAATLRRWEKHLRAIPARRFPGSTDRREPRYWQVRIDSPATLLAIRAIRARTTVDTSSILLTLFVVALARVVGVNPVVTQVVASNRFRRGLTDTVSPVTHPGLCVVDLADTGFDEALTLVEARSTAAYRYAYYDPAALCDVIARVSRERGEELDLACFFNDRRLLTRDHTDGPPPTPAELRAALGRTTLRWSSQDRPIERLFVTINDEPDTLDYEIFGDTHHVAPADLEACGLAMEAMAVEAAFDPAARVLAPAPAGAR
jgi:hypothetical protein